MKFRWDTEKWRTQIGELSHGRWHVFEYCIYMKSISSTSLFYPIMPNSYHVLTKLLRGKLDFTLPLCSVNSCSVPHAWHCKNIVIIKNWFMAHWFSLTVSPVISVAFSNITRLFMPQSSLPLCFDFAIPKFCDGLRQAEKMATYMSRHLYASLLLRKY